MTDAPGLPPEQDAVRRLLADARHRGSTPPEVVARLDGVLAGLVADRTPGTPAPREDTAGPTGTAVATPAAPVVDLAARRRRLAGAGLLAAAAVVVAGVAIGQGLPTSGGRSDSAASSDGGSGLDRDLGGGGSAAEGQDDSSSQVAPQLKSEKASPEAAPPALATDDAALPDALLALRPSAEPSGSGAPGSFDSSAACLAPRTGPGRRVAAEVDGEAGLVVYRRPVAGTQVVALYVCDLPAPVRTVTLPAP